MDQSRQEDLARLKRIMDDPSEPMSRRRQAHRAFEKIKKKMNDPFIKSNRERLLRAVAANDTLETDKISELIHDYDKRTYGD